MNMQPRDRSYAKEMKKRFLRYKEGADYYSMSQMYLSSENSVKRLSKIQSLCSE